MYKYTLDETWPIDHTLVDDYPGDFALPDEPDYDIQHSYHINVAMVKLYIDGLLPIYRWLTLGARFEYWHASEKMFNIEQEVHGFPVPTSLDVDSDPTTSQDFAEQRIVVNACQEMTHMFNPMIFAQFLIVKRLSIDVKFGYLICMKVKPTIFYTADDYRNTGDIDGSGTFSRYPYFNFARDYKDNRVTANISGVNFSVGVSLHI